MNLNFSMKLVYWPSSISKTPPITTRQVLRLFFHKCVRVIIKWFLILIFTFDLISISMFCPWMHVWITIFIVFFHGIAKIVVFLKKKSHSMWKIKNGSLLFVDSIINCCYGYKSNALLLVFLHNIMQKTRKGLLFTF